MVEIKMERPAAPPPVLAAVPRLRPGVLPVDQTLMPAAVSIPPTLMVINAPVPMTLTEMSVFAAVSAVKQLCVMYYIRIKCC